MRAGKLYDYTGGLADLADKRIRFIGAPERRIAEDYLRILRFFRFSAAYGAGPLDPQGFEACVALRAGLATLSRERIGAEFLKMLSASRAGAVVATMARSGLLAFLPVAPWPERLQAFLALGTPDALLALAALALHSESDADRLAEALRLSNAQRRRLAVMAKAAAAWHGAETPPSPAQLREALFVHGAQGARDALALVHAESGAPPDDAGFAAADAFLRDTPAPKLPFNANDLLQRGVVQGAGLGGALKRLQALWIRAGFPQDPQTVARLIDEASAMGPSESRWTRPRQ